MIAYSMKLLKQFHHTYITMGFPVAASGKELAAPAGDMRGVSSIPGSGRSSEGGRGNPLQYSCLENPVDRGAWWAPVHKVTQSQTRLKQLSTHATLPDYTQLLE